MFRVLVRRRTAAVVFIAGAVLVILGVYSASLELITRRLLRPHATGTAEEYEDADPRSSAVPDGLVRFLPVKSLLKDYLMVPGVALHGIGDMYEHHSKYNISDIRAACNRFGASCKGFMYSRNPSRGGLWSRMKVSFGVPIQADEWSLYIKKQYADLYINGLKTNLTCAAPLVKLTEGDGGCKFPKLQTYYKEIAHLVKRLPPITCDDKYLYTKLENNVLSIRDGVQKDGGLMSAAAKPIRRGKDDYTIVRGPPQLLNFSMKSFKIQEDFWEVTSLLKNQQEKTTFHLDIVEKPEVHQRVRTDDAPLDVMIVALDSTSAVHFERMLPKTLAYLKDELRSHFFKGYSAVGDGTFENMNSLLTGLTAQECREAAKSKGAGKTVDDWPFVFTDLTKNGFATLWSEDFAVYGAYSVSEGGFSRSPVDHYGRPFWIAASSGTCIGGQPQVRLQLDYLKGFMKAYPGRRKFGYTFLCDLCHRKVNTMSIGDLEILSFLKSSKEGNLLNNTMLIMMADHGPRFGQIRFTNQGKLEERLPFLSVTLPGWFRERFPVQFGNLVQNTELITSPYDLHATFLHLMSFSSPVKKDRKAHGTSLFQALPLNRTCADADINEQWCPCLSWQSVDTAHAHIKTAARVATSHINQRLAGNNLTVGLCHRLKLKRVLNAYQKMANLKVQDKVHEDECSYQIQFETSPSSAVFEGIVRFLYTGEIYVHGSISRINVYGSQPKCIEQQVPSMRKYCYCRQG